MHEQAQRTTIEEFADAGQVALVLGLPWITERDVFEGLRGLDLAACALPTHSDYLAHCQRCSGREPVQPFQIVRTEG